MRRCLSLHPIFAGLLVAFVGFASSFTVILQGLTGFGVSQAEATSDLMALTLAVGAFLVCGVLIVFTG
jgi:benzoate membrane transport protein